MRACDEKRGWLGNVDRQVKAQVEMLMEDLKQTEELHFRFGLKKETQTAWSSIPAVQEINN